MKKTNNYYSVRDAMTANPDATQKEIAAIAGVSLRTMQRIKDDLVAGGFDPKNNRYHKNPEGQIAKGYSTLARLKSKDDGSAGNVLEWIKTNVKLQDQYDTAKHLMQALVSEITPIENIKYQGPQKATKKQFTVIPIGDPHIGLKVWERQTGNSWDLEIAQRVFPKVFSRLLSQSPDTNEVVLVNTGDLFHADNIQGVTSRSGHRLDLDGTPGMWLDAGMIIMRMLVDACLRKYKKVTFVNVPGNHDDLLGRMMGGFIEQLYLHNKRVTVLKGDDPFQYIHRGKVLLGFAHGHTCRMPSLPGKMADDQAVLWGQTTYRQWITGHVHHNQWLQYKEHPGCKVESVGIIPPKDAYAHGGGYGADRTLQALVFDSEYGYLPRRLCENVRVDD